jgi:hypothetical protein
MGCNTKTRKNEGSERKGRGQLIFDAGLFVFSFFRVFVIRCWLRLGRVRYTLGFPDTVAPGLATFNFSSFTPFSKETASNKLSLSTGVATASDAPPNRYGTRHHVLPLVGSAAWTLGCKAIPTSAVRRKMY